MPEADTPTLLVLEGGDEDSGLLVVRDGTGFMFVLAQPEAGTASTCGPQSACGAVATGPGPFDNTSRRERGGVARRVSPRHRTLTLRSLERDGLVTRTAWATIPLRVEYVLTEPGFSLIGPLGAIAQWAFANEREISVARARFDAARHPSDMFASGKLRACRWANCGRLGGK